jgi:hypothetical protein
MNKLFEKIVDKIKKKKKIEDMTKEEIEKRIREIDENYEVLSMEAPTL